MNDEKNPTNGKYCFGKSTTNSICFNDSRKKLDDAVNLSDEAFDKLSNQDLGIIAYDSETHLIDVMIEKYCPHVETK